MFSLKTQQWFIFIISDKMGLPQLGSCCFVFDLKTGTTILGIINAVSFLYVCMYYYSLNDIILGVSHINNCKIEKKYIMKIFT